MKCTDCKYCIEQDTGHSNWSAEGIDVDCLLGLNPDFPEDEFYGEDPCLLYAQKCNNFTKGAGVKVNVDLEEGKLEDYSENIEVKELLKKYAAKK